MAEKKERKMVTVFINREYEGQDSVFVGVNGTNYQIMTDTEVEVPEEVAHILSNIKAQRAETLKIARSGGKKK